MIGITGELDLSQIADEQLDSDLDLRVAVVRDGSVLASTVLKAGSARQRRLPFEIELEPPVLPGAGLRPSYSQALAQGAPRALWYGGDFKVSLRGSDFPECCAYLLRLWAWKRTTNGCSDPSVTHANQFELSFTVLRPDLCPGICSDRKMEIA